MLVNARFDRKKPDIGAMDAKDYSLYDMHFHSRHSDGINKVDNIIRYAKKIGIGLAITDHNEIAGSVEASRYPGVSVIPGTELTSSEGIHLLLYFYKTSDLEFFYNKHIIRSKGKNPMIPLNLGINELLDIAKEFNAITCAAHPFAIMWTGLCKAHHKNIVSKKTYEKVEAIEIMTGSNTKTMNKRALDFAEKTKKSITAGTDGHTLHEMGHVLSYTKYPASPEEFLDSVRKNANFVVGKENSMLKKAAFHSVKIRTSGKVPVPYIKRTFNYLRISSRNKAKEIRQRF